MSLIKVSSQSRTASIAGAIAGTVRDEGKAEIQSIGAGSINQTMKAMVLARGYLKEDGIDVICYPEFVDLDFDGREVTAIKLIVEPR
ncbi:MAG: stage V sporulation protein S [Flavobacterium sp.]|jgi:stage V sporulation protein S|nr:stage V sporulation protein S [Flavobacterium sp.]